MAGSRRLVLTWVIMALSLGGLTFLARAQPPEAASDDARLESARATGSVRADGRTNTSTQLSPSSQPLPSAFGDSLSATVGITHTSFLPSVYNNFVVCPQSSFGVQIYQIDPALAGLIAQMGACWVRIPLYWAPIEPANTTPEHYQWPSSFDEGLAALSARHVKIILTLSNNPSWAATYVNGPVDLVDLSELAQFMVAAVEHYGAPPYNVKYWEFYNEPDNGNRWLAAERGASYFGNQPAVYVEMLAAVYQPMKAADPQAQIVMGGLAYDYWTDVGGPFVKAFLDGVLQSGRGDFFDVMNFHYYTAFRPNWEPYGHDIIGKATYLRDKLASYDVDKPFICTESGITSDNLFNPPSNDELQSRYVPQLFVRSQAADLGATIWFMLSDIPGLPPWTVGLLDTSLQPKPSYYAFVTLVQQLSQTEYVRTLGPFEIGSAPIEAYEFLTQDGLTRIIVAWTTDESNQQMVFRTERVILVDKFGGTTTINDRDDGILNGHVQVTIGPSPVYLRMAP